LDGSVAVRDKTRLVGAVDAEQLELTLNRTASHDLRHLVVVVVNRHKSKGHQVVYIFDNHWIELDDG